MPHVQARHHLMPAPRERLQHVERLFLVMRLAEHRAVHDDDRVRRDDDVLRCGGLRDLRGLQPAHARDLPLRRERLVHRLVDIGGVYRKFQPQQAHQLLPPGRFGR